MVSRALKTVVSILQSTRFMLNLIYLSGNRQYCNMLYGLDYSVSLLSLHKSLEKKEHKHFGWSSISSEWIFLGDTRGKHWLDHLNIFLLYIHCIRKCKYEYYWKNICLESNVSLFISFSLCLNGKWKDMTLMYVDKSNSTSVSTEKSIWVKHI